ncbi:YciI family protein [Planosporangium thailandense]|uniref:YciI family protein n=1 Tax=Planosporangium thailandense TaxID=765197 RepID=A0ABX0XYW2_9ACTN|nr:YciI family protein [Planosporangium thailandense]NJC71265.1 YciI family protein [Planosporangium thailandense]
MQYMLLIYETERAEPGSDELAASIAAVNAFTAEVIERGVFVAAGPLAPPSAATTVRVRDGERVLTDGPFAETAEWLGGYYILDCTDLDEALDFAARFPSAATGAVEVRPIPAVAGPHRAEAAAGTAG